jgi:hypothetical protein
MTKKISFSGEFIILENNNIASFGRIRVLEDDILHNQNLIHQIPAVNNDSLVLDSNDVYKDFRVRGYDYGPKFKGIQETRIRGLDNIYSSIKWTGNWISFMDCVIQVMSSAVHFRNVFVPVIITSLRCNPKVLFEAIEESKQAIHDKNNPEPEMDIETKFENFVENKELVNDFKSDTAENEELAEMKKLMEPEIKQFEKLLEKGAKEKFVSILSVYCDINLRLTVTHGIELKNLIAVPIPRKIASQEVVYESYQFIPNEENAAIDIGLKKEITDYLQVLNIF